MFSLLTPYIVAANMVDNFGLHIDKMLTSTRILHGSISWMGTLIMSTPSGEHFT